MEANQPRRSPSATRQRPVSSSNSFYVPSDNAGGIQAGASPYDNSVVFGDQFSSGQGAFGVVSDFGAGASGFGGQNPTFTQPNFLDNNLPDGLNAGDPNFGQDNLLFNNFGSAPGLKGFGYDPLLFGDASTENFDATASALDTPLLASTSSSASPQHPMQNMASNHQSTPTPPHLLSPIINRKSSSSPQGSPGLHQGGFAPPGGRHSRNASLDPSSAAYPQGQWTGMNFQNHRRVPSDAHSDVSSQHNSPFLATHDSFDGVDNHSPLLTPQDPSMYSEVMGIGSFSINEASHPFISPGHSPHVSPRLPPQQQLPAFTSADNYGMNLGLAPPLNGFNEHQGMEMFAGQGHETFPLLNNQGEAMSPPEINVVLAPPSRQASFEPPKDETTDTGALSPPESSRSRNRTRAKSDSSLGPRSHSSSGHNRESKHMLSPAAAGVGSRSASPSGKNRRSSTSSVPNRDYLLGLADPSRSPSEASENLPAGSRRTQKHPATFQCSLCPKRFTRAYNLRSHLRTHTDERPFVCSVCGKAFARQHDRKRHESLHSGEKKFVCRGNLKDGGNWGCGRRFARADALGRHFRSEAGRVCINPLLEEEARDRMAKDAGAGAQMPGMPLGASGPLDFDAVGGMSGGQAWDPSMGGVPPMLYRLPTVLLQQYPSLGGIWDTLPAHVPNDIEDEMGAQNNFDASGGEYDDAEDFGGGAQSGWASDVGAY